MSFAAGKVIHYAAPVPGGWCILTAGIDSQLRNRYENVCLGLGAGRRKLTY